MDEPEVAHHYTEVEIYFIFPCGQYSEETSFNTPSEMPLAIPHFRGRDFPAPALQKHPLGSRPGARKWHNELHFFSFWPLSWGWVTCMVLPDYTKAHQTVGHCPEVSASAPNLSPLTSNRGNWTNRGLSGSGPPLLAAPTSSFPSQHHISKVLPFLVTWLNRGRGSSYMTFPMFFSNSNWGQGDYEF